MNRRRRVPDHGFLIPFLVCCAVLLLSKPCKAAPDILLITIDTLRADRLGCYGDSEVLTSEIDALSRSSRLEIDASTDIPLTLPSHVSLFSGLPITQHAVQDNGRIVPEHIPLLAEILRKNGYRTMAVISGFPLVRATGLNRGFDVYRDHLPAVVQGHRPEQIAEEAVAAAECLIEKKRNPLFLWVHLYDPHAPYSAPPSYRAASRDDYRAEVMYTDRWTGRLIRSFRRRMGSDSPIVITGDHGEGLGDHGESTHGVFLYQETIRIPVICASMAADRLVSSPTTIHRIMHRILGYAGVQATPPPGKTDGMLGMYTPYPFSRYRWAPESAVRRGALKFMDHPPELYDLEQDPGERHNLASRRESECSDLRNRLRLVPPRPAADHDGVDPETRRALESLGYIIHPGASDESGSRKEARSLKDLLIPIELGLEKIRLGAWTDAEALFRSLLSADPDNPVITNNLGLALIQLNRPKEAGEFLRKAARAVPDDVQIMNNLGIALIRDNRFKDAEEVLKKAVALDRSFAPAHLNLAGAQFALNRQEDAGRELDEAIRLDPSLAATATAEAIRKGIVREATE